MRRQIALVLLLVSPGVPVLAESANEAAVRRAEAAADRAEAAARRTEAAADRVDAAVKRIEELAERMSQEHGGAARGTRAEHTR
jgi:methyl-accepting chemotaxis protein